ncbi:MAG: winged helix-turn-helix domain-containing protein [Terriglobales bacterium]
MNSKGFEIQTAQSSGRVARFAGCEFEELSLQLGVKGCAADLELKPLEVLLQLLLRAREVVSKEVLLDSVCPGLNVVDGSLATAVSKLRKVLGDETSEVIFIVPRVGYRLAVRYRPNRSLLYPRGEKLNSIRATRSQVARGGASVEWPTWAAISFRVQQTAADSHPDP